ncbi:MAG TPA: acetyl-CoA carboxylase carboxyl transferase subunit alpha, partial [Lachnospiraceae bacterium]|nr:acetyl-CoA carboxylase carboxyl transferase subunit alpha [Lachnospiraceae bacterium]
ESCANILWKDRNKAAQAADALKLTATDLLEMSVIERIVEEPRQYQYDIQNDIFYGNLKKDLLGKIHALESLDVEQLLENRYEKYRKIGGNNRVTI